MHNVLHLGYVETRGNCYTLNSSDQNQARVMKLNLQMLSTIISLPVEKEHNHFIQNTDFVV